MVGIFLLDKTCNINEAIKINPTLSSARTEPAAIGGEPWSTFGNLPSIVGGGGKHLKLTARPSLNWIIQFPPAYKVRGYRGIKSTLKAFFRRNDRIGDRSNNDISRLSSRFDLSSRSFLFSSSIFFIYLSVRPRNDSFVKRKNREFFGKKIWIYLFLTYF